MHMTFRFRQNVNAPVQRVAAFFETADNLVRITPPVPRLRIHVSETTIATGKVLPMSLDLRVVQFRWESVIESVEPGYSFTDTMRGRFIRFWRHMHRYEDHGGQTQLTDEIECDVPWWVAVFVWLGVHALFFYRRFALPGALK